MGKLKPALLGGVAAGVLSIIPIVKLCCFLWGIGGGFLAAFLYYRENGKINTREGTLVGLFAGLIAGALAGIVNIAINIMMSSVMQAMSQLPTNTGMMGSYTGPLWYLLSFLITLLIMGVFCLIGGVIGAAVFQNQGKDQEDKKAAQAKKVN